MSTNGKSSGATWQVVQMLLTLLLGLVVWVAKDSLATTRADLAELKNATSAERNRITVLETLRPGDRQILEELQREQARQSRMLASIAARLNIQEAR